MLKRTTFLPLILLCTVIDAEPQPRRKVNGPPFSYPPGGHVLQDQNEVLKLLAARGARLAASPPAFTCSSLAARAAGFRTSITLDFGSVPKGFRDLDGVEIDGTETLQGALRELFLEGATFTYGYHTTLEKRRVVVARHVEDDRDAMVYVDFKTGAIAGLRLRGYPIRQPVAALQCWALEQ